MSEVAPDPIADAVARASALCDLRRFAEAAVELGPAIASEPDRPVVWCVLARAHLGENRLGPAKEAATRAASLAPEDDWPHRLLSTISLRLGYPDRAADSAREAARVAPHEWRVYVTLARAESALGNHELAGTAAAGALEIAPDEPEAILTAGNVAAVAGQRKDAAEYYRRALAVDPQNSRAHDALARVTARRTIVAHANAGRLATSAGGFAAALRADPGSSASRLALDSVIRIFLRRLAYFIFLAAWVGYVAAANTGAQALRWLPVLLVVAPILYAGWFIARLAPQLRRYLAEHVGARQRWVPIGLEVGAIIAVVLGSVASGDMRKGLAEGAVLGALAARLILRRTA